jgi:hypothetical protein
MKNGLVLVIFSLSQFTLLDAQEIFSPRIKGMRINGQAAARLPIVARETRSFSVEFDIDESEPPNFRLRVVHCDRNWHPTETTFLNNEIDHRARAPLFHEVAPAGVQAYRYTYKFRLPGIAGLERFRYSGNYLFEILDDDWTEVLARGRFFVVEEIVQPSLRVSNRQQSSEPYPWYMVNRVEVSFAVPHPDSIRDEQFFPFLVTTVDIYKNRELYRPIRIDVNDRDPHTFVEGVGLSKLSFRVDNIRPGNEYRRIDLRSVDEYPPGGYHRSRTGADVSRFLQAAPRDQNGVSTYVTGTRYADYITFQFELSHETEEFDSVFVVGDFTGWRVDPRFVMRYNWETRRYVVPVTLRRGVHEYQYVVGNDDWISLEGNDWRTVNLYTAFVYYRDQRFGGFDRLVGFVQGSILGGTSGISP